MLASIWIFNIHLNILVLKHTFVVVLEEVDVLLLVVVEVAVEVCIEKLTNVVITTKLVVVGGLVEVEENAASFLVVICPMVRVSDWATDVEFAVNIISAVVVSAEVEVVASAGDISVVSLMVESRSAAPSIDVVSKIVFVVFSDLGKVVLRVVGLVVSEKTSIWRPK